MKGIILAGGAGTRLHPITKGISKQLLPIYDKPMVYYPMSVLMLAGIKDVLIISTPDDIRNYQKLFGDGAQLGICVQYAVQPKPDGLAQSFIIGDKFIGEDNVCLILGDNFFYGQGFGAALSEASTLTMGANLFGYRVPDPERFGIAELDVEGNVVSLEEKPMNPKSNCAITGLYFYDNQVVDIAKSLTPSARGELEITSINQVYLSRGKLNLTLLGRGFTWLDAGTHDSLLETSHFVQTVERRQGLKVACLEEIAFNNKWIDGEQLKKQAMEFKNSGYGEYLNKLSANL